MITVPTVDEELIQAVKDGKISENLVDGYMERFRGEASQGGRVISQGRSVPDF